MYNVSTTVTVPVAFDTEPVTVSPTWKGPLVTLAYASLLLFATVIV